MHQHMSYEGQFDTWMPNSTTLLNEPKEADIVARALVECDRTKQYEKYDWIANMLLDSLEVNAYLSVLCQAHNARPAGKFK
jgi:hypothetical protein